MIVREMQLGPPVSAWATEAPRGNCHECGGQCDGGECGAHALGCIFGGFTEQTSYWVYNPECPLWHGDSK